MANDLDWMLAPVSLDDNLSLDPEGLSLGDIVDGSSIESHKPLAQARQVALKLKRTYLRALNNEKIAQFLQMPQPGESIHLVTNGAYDYFFFVPHLLRLLKKPLTEFWAITWTAHQTAILELFRLMDAAQLGAVNILTSTHFKNTKPELVSSLISGLRERGHRYRALKSHAKIVMMASPPHYLVLEGSANWTKYPGAEQNCLVNDEGLFRFHCEWMEEVFSA